MPIYLDFNASAPTRQRVVDAMMPHFRELHGNPSSTHFYGQRARASVEKARKQVADLIGANAEELLFLSGGTEADNMVLASFAEPGGKAIACSSIEHPAIHNMATRLEKNGCSIVEIPVGKDGIVDLDFLDSQLKEQDIVLVSIMVANNETGVLQPMEEIIDLCHQHGALVHTDAAQMIGKAPFSLGKYPVDLVTIASHKMGGPLGIGALYIKSELQLDRYFEGGSQETNRRPGTESVPLIVGLGEAAQIIHESGEAEISRMSALRDRMETNLVEILENLHFNNADSPRLSNTSSITVKGISAEMLVIRMDLEGFAISSGSACHSGRTEPSRILKAMGFSDTHATSSVRVSLGPETTENQIDSFVDTFGRVVTELRNHEISEED